MLQENDIEAALAIFNDIIDEIYETSSERERRKFKHSYWVYKVKKRLNEPDCVYLTGKVQGEIVCFLFAWVREGVGNINWLGVKKEHRLNGYGKMLAEKAVNEFKNRHCHEARVFTSQQIAFKVFEKFGFNNITYINKFFFGVNIAQMVMKLSEAEDYTQIKKLIISGEAGQGIKLISHSLASILTKLGNEVVLNLAYDSRVMGSNITAELIYSNKKIETPFFMEADIAIQLSRTFNPSIRAKKMIFEESIDKIALKKNEAHYEKRNIVPFERISDLHFHSTVFVNMIALGKLLNLIGIRIEQINFASEFPARFLDENIKAVKYGYSHRDWF